MILFAQRNVTSYVQLLGTDYAITPELIIQVVHVPIAMYHGQMLHYLTRDFEDIIPGDFRTFVTGNMTHEKPTELMMRQHFHLSHTIGLISYKVGEQHHCD